MIRIPLSLSLGMSAARAIACNDRAAARGLSFTASNEAMISQEVSPDDWIKLSPYGEFPVVVNVKENGKLAPKRFLQVVNRQQADIMVKAFNSWLSKAGKLFRGAPIYIGHPDVDPGNYPDHARRGGIKELQAREDGLWGKPAWNDLGIKNLEEGYFVYPSPAWDFELPASGNKIYPDELVSVGLTNTPNIEASEPVTNEAKSGSEETNNENANMKKLHQLLNVPEEKGEDGLADAINKLQAHNSRLSTACNAIRKACNDAGLSDDVMMDTATNELSGDKLASVLLTKLNDGTKAITDLTAANARLTTINAERSKEVVDRAITEGRITEADRVTHMTALNANFETGRTAINALQPKLDTTKIMIGNAKLDISSAAERSRVINTAVQEYMAKHNCEYNVAFNAVKADKQFAPVFQAMQTPGKDKENSGK